MTVLVAIRSESVPLVQEGGEYDSGISYRDVKRRGGSRVWLAMLQAVHGISSNKRGVVKVKGVKTAHGI